MWKKNESTSDASEEHNIKADTVESPMASRTSANTATKVSDKPRAFIGRSIQINGEIVGNEDLVVDGKVTGKIILKSNNLIVDKEGIVDADIEAKCVDIEGKVIGHVTCFDKITIRKSGDVTGDIIADRVILEDGCQFKGTIDMKSSNTKDTPVVKAESIGELKPHLSNVSAPENKTTAADFAKSTFK